MDEHDRHIYKKLEDMDDVNYHGTVSNEQMREELQKRIISRISISLYGDLYNCME